MGVSVKGNAGHQVTVVSPADPSFGQVLEEGDGIGVSDIGIL